MEVAKPPRQQGSTGNVASETADGVAGSELEEALDRWRQEIGSERGIFPHSVLSSQHVAALSALSGEVSRRQVRVNAPVLEAT